MIIRQFMRYIFIPKVLAANINLKRFLQILQVLWEKLRAIRKGFFKEFKNHKLIKGEFQLMNCGQLMVLNLKKKKVKFLKQA